MTEQDIQKYQQMLEEDPESRAFAPLAEAYRKVGNLEEAIRVAEAGLEIHPGYTGGLVVLGRAHYEKKDLDKAYEVLHKAVAETPESYLGQKFLGKVLMDKGEVQDALRALEAANLLSPDDQEVVELLEEVRPKATPPKSMDYSVDHSDEEGEEPQIVTYEQKPTTIDGVELEPLPLELDEETFSFSEYQEDREAAPAVPVSTGEETAEEKSGFIDELGPEAAAFIEEAEELEADSFSIIPTETEDAGESEADSFSVTVEGPEEEGDAFVIEDPTEGPLMEPEAEVSTSPPVETPDRAPIQQPEVPPGLEAAPLPEEPSPPPHDEPVDQVPFEIPSPSVEPLSESTDSRHEEASGGQHVEPSFDPTATGGTISTETLADLYAKQGLTEKAVEIYQQILQENPDDHGVHFKLRTLEESAQKKLQEETSQPVASPESEVVSIDPDDPVATLESWLKNAERMKGT
jgi:tetratricopeptide (TPR) repeat protein